MLVIMSTIYSLPTTIIQTNGSRVYRIRTRDYDQVLQHVEVESKTNETINLNFEDLYFQSIAFASNSDLGEPTLKCIRETKDIKNYYTVDSRPLTCSAELKDAYLPELQFLVSKGYNIDIPQPIFKDMTLDLNHQWRRCQTYDSPLEGWTLYESASNWHVGGASAICYLNIISNDAPLVIYYCSYAENQFDWLNIGFPDGTGVDTLRTPQQPPTSIDRMTIIEKDATMTGLCTITYFKDSSGDSGDDRAYILIPNDVPFINEYEEEPPVETGNIYSSGYQGQSVLDKETATWVPKTWNGLSSFSAEGIWTDGENIYYSSSSTQYVLDKETSTWVPKTWNGINPDAQYIWTDGENIYYSGNSEDSQYVLDKTTDTWVPKNWGLYTPVDGRSVWTDGVNIYYNPSWSFLPYLILDKETSTWRDITWPSQAPSDTCWTDGENIYRGNDKLDKATLTWIPNALSGYDVLGANIWTDGENIYYFDTHVLDKETSTWVPKTWSGDNPGCSNYNLWTDEPKFRVLCMLRRGTFGRL